MRAFSGATPRTNRRSLNRPQRKLLTWIKVGIFEENKIKPTMAIPTEARLIFSKLESTKFAWVIFSANLNGYEIFII